MNMDELLNQEYVATRDARFWAVVSLEEKPYNCNLVMFDKPVGLGRDFPSAEANVILQYSADSPEDSVLVKEANILQIKESLTRMVCVLNLGEITLAFTHGQHVPTIPIEIVGKLVEKGTMVEVDPATEKNKEAGGGNAGDFMNQWREFTGLGKGGKE